MESLLPSVGSFLNSLALMGIWLPTAGLRVGLMPRIVCLVTAMWYLIITFLSAHLTTLHFSYRFCRMCSFLFFCFWVWNCGRYWDKPDAPELSIWPY
jgi:hypothetical protein